MNPDALTETLSRLTDLLTEQATASARREERLLALAESATQTRPQHSTLTDSAADRTDAAGADPGSATRGTRRLGATATPAPRLMEGASLREFASWRDKFEGYATLTGLYDLPPASQTAALVALLDDQWTRTLRHGLDIDVSTSDIQTIIRGVERHLIRQRNVILDRR